MGGRGEGKRERRWEGEGRVGRGGEGGRLEGRGRVRRK